jgi:hypothetical protein
VRKSAVKESKKPELRFTGGEPVMVRLDSVRPNGWNPNTMSHFERQSIRFSFKRDGWMASMAMLVWGKDEHGEERNIIIDGEQRWTVGKQIGMEKGPAVFLDGITEAQAKALTIKLDQKRGHFDDQALGVLLRGIEHSLDLETRALDLGIQERELAKFMPLRSLEPEPEKGVVGELPSGQTSQVVRVMLYFSHEQAAEFARMTKALALRLGLKDTTAVVVQAMRNVA